MQPEAAHLGARSVDAVLWGAGGAALRLLLQLGTQIALARMLGPEQYGIFAIGATVIAFSAFLSDVGLAYGLIQKTELTSRDVRFVFTWQIALGAVVTFGVFVGAPWIAAFFSEPRAASVVSVLALLCLVNALTAPSLNLLKRSLDFKSIQLAQLLSYALGYLVVGIPLALWGAQVWALVAAWMVQAASNGLLLYRKTRHAVRPLLWHAESAAQLRYGGTVLGTNLVNWLIGNVDRVVVGRMFGSRDIGLYATSYNLLYGPSTTLLGVVQPVFFAASSRIADDPARIASGYRALLAGLCMLVLPVFAAIAVLADTVVLALYGDAWHQAAALLRPLALVMPLFMLFGLTTPLLWTSGRVARELQLQLPLAVLWVAACAWAATWSVPAVAWTVLGLYALRSTIVVAAASSALRLSTAELGRAARGGLLISVLVALALALSNTALQGWPAWLRLLLLAPLALLVWLLALRIAPKLIAPELAELFGRVLGRLPPALSRRLAFLTRHRT